MSALVSKFISQADRLPFISNATLLSIFTSKKNEGNPMESGRRASIEDYPNEELYSQTTLRYSLAPPTYDNVVKEDSKRFVKALSTLWKRASFSSAGTNTTTNDTISQQTTTSSTTTTTIDKKQLEHAITLIKLATDMNNSGNQQMAMDIYMMGLDKLMSALPLEDVRVKSALEKKLTEMKHVHQLNIRLEDELLPDEGSVVEQVIAEDAPIRSQLSNLVIHAAVLSAVALKKSPIPVDAFSTVMKYAIDGMRAMDQKHQLRRRAWELAASGITKAVEIDSQFEIHQMVTGAFCTGFAAFIKAVLAYAETPGHHQVA